MATGEYVHACVTYTCFILQAYVFQMFITAFEKPRAAESRPWAGREDRADRRKSVCRSQGRKARTARTRHRKGRVWDAATPLPVSLWVCRYGCVHTFTCVPPQHTCRSKRTTCADQFSLPSWGSWRLSSGLVAMPSPPNYTTAPAAFTSQITPLPLLLDLMQDNYINKPAFISEKASGVVCGHDWIAAGLAGS